MLTVLRGTDSGCMIAHVNSLFHYLILGCVHRRDRVVCVKGGARMKSLFFVLLYMETYQ